MILLDYRFVVGPVGFFGIYVTGGGSFKSQPSVRY